ncbi:WecB/TagA/CpsF family glycosyltransferase [Dissulfurirhabdus thermomarina]|uniref:WecB/TagA/CpsF family glycosyltransferase n=1 Tax=Dissulfurirhabdus thermomarina TaxID=1765737 RepID=A0A6N9TMN3_DISTH|nr:WecB/TagA/CpsF family glycosyltransferase [Dissulfurirhabdus thermomarina]NDY42542.1 WecB/TagA/CpsF family glycosyltransferase [Dissulfurirhabdus thermomarina]NMX23536.1 WecB/TagA/CpsF family glycosyltransferase [Dissulfurirhabdus thermomarina]
MERNKLFGFDFVTCECVEHVAEYIINFEIFDLDDNKIPFVITPNVDQIVKFNHYFELRSFYDKSFLILPDGAPVIVVSRLLGKPLAGRLTGSDLFGVLFKRIKAKNERCFFVVSRNKIGLKLMSEYDNIIWEAAPFFDADDRVMIGNLANKYSGVIEREMPKYVFIGLGFPKQERLGKLIFLKLMERRKYVPVFLLLGAAFEFYTGLKRRAPLLMRRLGLEWFFRLMLEPRRLSKRYLFDDLQFVKILLHELANSKNVD